MAHTNWLSVLGWGQAEMNDLRLIAYSYIRQGVYDVALTFFDALAVLEAPTPYDLQTLGALYLQMGDGLKALDALDRALQLDARHLPTQLNRAKALLMLGYKQQGLLAATELARSGDPHIASQVTALVLAYR